MQNRTKALPWNTPGWHLIAFICLIFCLIWVQSGCSSQATPIKAANAPEQDRWFCQPNVAGDDWDCVQDNALAENPTNVRPLPAPAPEPISAPSLAPQIELQGRIQTPVTNSTAATVQDAPEIAPQPDPSLPRYAQLAQYPQAGQGLQDLSGEYYAAQIIAYRSQDDVDRFAVIHQLPQITSARIAKDGELFYVALLGIYATRSVAEEAVASVPELADTKVWIRRMRGLHKAIKRADVLTGTPSPT